MNLLQDVSTLLHSLGVAREAYTGGTLQVRSPITGTLIAEVPQVTATDVDAAIATADAAFRAWRNVPAPWRGELVRLLGEELRAA